MIAGGAYVSMFFIGMYAVPERVAQRWAQFALLCGSFYNRAHVATSTAGGLGPLVLCHVPAASPAADSHAVGILYSGGGDRRTPSRAWLPAGRLGVSP